MKDPLILPPDYFEKFIEYENELRKKHQGAYFSKPHVRIKNDGKAIATAPWGNPGWSSPVIFAFCHYYSVTFINENQTLETLVFDHAVLMSFLEKSFVVEEIESPTPYILIKIPDLMIDFELEQKFLANLTKLQSLKD